MRKTIYILFISVGLLPVFTFGQELPLFSNYTVNPLIYNPANAGQSNDIQTFLHQRTQWTGFKGSPVSHLLTMSAPLTKINSGIGISVQNDQRGLFNTLIGSVKYAYHAKINQQSRLSLGVGIDVQNRLLRIGESTVRDVDDPLLNNGSLSETFMDASFGIEYHFLNKLSIGLSAPQLLKGNGGGDFYVKNSRYFISQISYMFEVSSSKNIKLQPLVLARYSNNIPLQYDINALLHYKDMFMIGTGYRSNYALNFHAGVVLKNLTFRYVYDFATVNSNLNSGLSHEITLGYTFGLNKKEPVILPQEDTMVEEEEPLSADKIRAILNLLIDEYFESGNNNPEELKKVELLKETIFNLLDSMDKKE
ncbi:MAG: type IX secretion system membrane protein PorP/SprF [Bacteroidetes bacterium]|nr:type IX secretion system membrane protein PorP/SprF [Bacteroidota bacterium]